MSTEILDAREYRWPDRSAGPWILRLTFAIVDGRPGVVGVELYAVDPEKIPGAGKVYKRPSRKTRRITTAGMRVPLADLMVEYLPQAQRSAELRANAQPSWLEQAASHLGTPAETIRTISSKKARAISSALPPQPRGRPRRPADATRGLYEEAARIYNEAFAAGRRPLTKVIGDEMHVAKSTAGKYVAGARALGLLPQTTPGKAKGFPIQRSRARSADRSKKEQAT